MLMRPIDAQVMVNRSTEVSRQQSDLQNKNNMAENVNMERIQHGSENKIRNVNNKENAQQALIREKQEKSNEQGRKKKRLKEEKKVKDTFDGEKHTIDIRL